MKTADPPAVQRWLWGRDSYRIPDEPIETRLYDVCPIADDATARAFVESHHYSRSYPAARRRFGLYRRGELVGVAVFSHPTNDRTITGTFPGLRATDGVELGRFVLLDEVPANGETWFLGRCFDALRREGFAGVVAFSDPVRRESADGRVVLPGHVGTIYQAHNGRYLGRSSARSLLLLPDARVLSSRSMQKIRARERGWCGAADVLVTLGADSPWNDSAAWLTHWTDPARGICRALRHRGNHRYAWTLDRRRRGTLAASLPFPKQPELGAHDQSVK